MMMAGRHPVAVCNAGRHPAQSHHSMSSQVAEWTSLGFVKASIPLGLVQTAHLAKLGQNITGSPVVTHSCDPRISSKVL